MASQHTCSSASRLTEFHTASRGAQIAHSLRLSNQPLPQPATQSMRIGVHQPKPFQSRSARISNKSSVSQLGGSVEECAICMMAMSDKCELDCSHKFCLGCVGEWFKTSKKCPLCRKRIHQYRSGSHLMAVAVSQSDSSFSLGSEWYSDQMSDASQADELVICQLCGESPFEEDLVIFCAGCQMSICHETCADLVGMGGPAWLCAGCQHACFQKQLGGKRSGLGRGLIEGMNDLEDLAEEDYECMRKAIQDKEQDNLKDFNSRIVNELLKMGPKALKELQLQSSLPQSQNHPAEEQSHASLEEGNQGEESEPIFGIDYMGNSSEDDYLSAKFHREREAAQSFADASSAHPLQKGCLFNVLKTTLRKLEQYIANTLGKSIISLPAQDVRKLSKVLQSPRSILSNSHVQTLRTMVRLAYQSEPQGRHPEMINLYSELIHYLQREKESKRAFGRPIDSEVQNRICQLYVEHETLDQVREELRSSCPAWKDEGNAGIKWRLEHIMRLSLRKLEAVIAEMEEKQFRPILKENERRMIVHCQEAHQTRIQLVKFYLQQDCDIPELLILTKSIAESLKRIHKRTEKGRNRTSQRNRRTAAEEQKELDLEESQAESASSSELRTYRYRSKRRPKESKPQQTKRRSHNAPKPEKKQLTLQESYERRETSKSGEQKRRGLGSCWEDDKFIEQIARSINKEMKLAKRR